MLVTSVFSVVLKGSQGVEKVYRCRLSCLGNVCWCFTVNRLLCLCCTRLDKCCMVQCCSVSLWVPGCPVQSTDRDLCVVGPAVRQGSISGCRSCCPDPQCKHSLSQGAPPTTLCNPSQLGSPWTPGLGLRAKLHRLPSHLVFSCFEGPRRRSKEEVPSHRATEGRV